MDGDACWTISGVPWEDDPEEPDGQMSFEKDFPEFMPEAQEGSDNNDRAGSD